MTTDTKLDISKSVQDVQELLALGARIEASDSGVSAAAQRALKAAEQGVFEAEATASTLDAIVASADAGLGKTPKPAAEAELETV